VAQRVVFRPQAEDEVLEVRRWYESRHTGLGVEFGEAVDGLVARIAANPQAFQRAYKKHGAPSWRAFPTRSTTALLVTTSSFRRSTGGSIHLAGEGGRSFGSLVGAVMGTGSIDARWYNGELNPAFSGLTAGDFDVLRLGWR
jgi:hypothetical protein